MSTFKPASYAQIQQDMLKRFKDLSAMPDYHTVTRADIVAAICSHFMVTANDIHIEEGPGGRLKITIDGIDKQTQLAIHDYLDPLLPFGISLDIHRRNEPVNINRPPVWDLKDE